MAEFSETRNGQKLARLAGYSFEPIYWSVSTKLLNAFAAWLREDEEQKDDCAAFLRVCVTKGWWTVITSFAQEFFFGRACRKLARIYKVKNFRDVFTADYPDVYEALNATSDI